MTNNDVSGITVTDTTTLESQVTACADLIFGNPPGTQTYTYDAGPGTDCVTSDVKTYIPGTFFVPAGGDNTVIITEAP